MFHEYLDFEIQISPLSESRYAVSVSGPGGDASGALVLPSNDPTYLALAEQLARLDTDEAALAELGQILFQSLFQGAIRDVYIRSQGILAADQGLRLRLNIAAAAAEALALPWEFLYDPDQGPLALLDAPIVRYLPQSSRIPALAAPLPLKVLLAGAQTPPPATVEQELAEVAAALADLGEYVEITLEEHLTAQKLQKLAREGFHVLHFVGHGGFSRDGKTGVLFFEDAGGDAEPVSALQLGILLNRSGLRLVVLDACESAKLATEPLRSMAPALVRAQVPAVVAMQFQVPQEATRAFAAEFYRALAAGFPIDACVTEGRKAVMNASGLSNPDWGIPVVYTRAPDGRLFDLPDSVASALVPAAEPPAPAAPAAAPPALASAGPPPERRGNNLPATTTALVGRSDDIAAARALIERDDVRLLTLTGAGGTGKTRLAIQIAAEMTDQFAHGVWFVNLAPVGSGELVVATIAHTLGLKEAAGEPLLNTLKDYLRQRELLLVLDNFEQVLAAAPLIAELLADAAKLQAIVTSRAALRISGEYEFPVAPLALPNLRQLPALAELARNPSVALFVERARAVKPAFELSEANAQAVAEICARLDGLPLAIELAAVRTTVLAPQALLQRLARRLDILTGGARDLAARQQTLRGAIGWSYDLLGPAERALFASLAVFAGGAALDALEAVCERIGSWEVGAGGANPAPAPQPLTTILDGLASLVDKSLLRQIDTAAGETRFVMLQTIREFAQERLAELPGAAELGRRHAVYFLALAEQAEAGLAGSQQASWLDRLEGEHDNLRAALASAIEAGDAGGALRLAGALGRFWLVRGYLGEGRSWLERALALPAEAGDTRAKALNAAGVLAWSQGDYPSAERHHAACLGLRRAAGDPAKVAQSLNNLGIVASSAGSYQQAQAYYEECVAIYRQQSNQLGAARALNNLGVIAERQHDATQAQRYYQQSLALYRTLDDRQNAALLLGNLGALALAQAQHADARAHYLDALAQHQALGDRRGIAVDLGGLARVASAQQQPRRAAQLAAAAEVIWAALGSSLQPAELLVYQQDLDAARAQLAPAEWQAAWEAGRALSLDQALAEAARSGDTASTQAMAARAPSPTTAQVAAAAPPALVLLTPAGPVEVPREQLPVSIGRVEICDIVLNDTRVSRQHAWIMAREGQLLISDQGSTNGTFVNGERVTERALAHGDVLSFGGLEVNVQLAPA